MDIKILVVQLEAVKGDIDKNISKIKSLLSESKFLCADLIVLPELWTIGWDCSSFNSSCEELFSSKAYNFLKELALKYNSNIIGGSAVLRKDGEKDRNTCLVFNRSGNLISTYDKFHLFSHRGQSEGSFLEEGETPVVVKMDIGNIGLSICYDIRFPEMFRLYAFNDADLIVNMAAWPKAFTDEYVTLVKARAIENQIYLVSSCLTGKINETFDFSGNFFIVDYRGKVVASLGEEEKVLYASIDIEEMKQYRKQLPILKDTKLKYQIMEK
ncbi:MAG: hypothetical protein IJY61_07735 [Candidatus Gastranaerophilales bacterium]|nr:hypothetical protein [Candidatus Gastranaerophilales bacterium]